MTLNLIFLGFLRGRARRGIALIRNGQFSRAAQLAGSHGQAPASPDTVAAIRHLHPEPGVVAPEDLLEYYGPPVPVTRETTKLDISHTVLLECLDAAAPLSSPHRDGMEVRAFESASAG